MSFLVSLLRIFGGDRQQFLRLRCVKWADFKVAVKEKRISLDSPIPELPSNFKDSRLLVDRGIHTLVIYVFANVTELSISFIIQ
jgi:hypothetical protein